MKWVVKAPDREVLENDVGPILEIVYVWPVGWRVKCPKLEVVMNLNTCTLGVARDRAVQVLLASRRADVAWLERLEKRLP
jgi:hypothetical protein